MSDAAAGAIEAICAYVAERTGTNLSRQQRERLSRAAGEALGRRDAMAFVAHLQSREGARELAELMSVISVHKTDLFRDERQLTALKEHVLRALAITGRPLRLWSAGCSTGEEVATLLILLAEVGAHAASSVLGTDIAPAALAAARRLTFGAEAMRRVPPQVRQRWFTGAPEGAALVPELAARARFQRHNLMDTPYPFADDGELFDVIVCRNVFIYFTPEAVDRTVGLFAERLAPGGVLLLSAAEPILQARRDLETRRLKTAFFYVRPDRPSSAPVAREARSRAGEPALSPWSGAPSPRASAPGLPTTSSDAPLRGSSPSLARAAAPVAASKTGADAQPRSAASPDASPPELEGSTARAGAHARAAGSSDAQPPAPAPSSAPRPRASAPAPSTTSATARSEVPLLQPGPSSAPWRPGASAPPALTGSVTGEVLVPLTPEAEGRQLFELVLDWAAAGEPEAETEAGLRKALYLAPELAAARYMLGLLLEQRQARADAAAEYRRALALVDTGRAMPSAFFLNNERLGAACRIALARLGYR